MSKKNVFESFSKIRNSTRKRRAIAYSTGITCMRVPLADDLGLIEGPLPAFNTSAFIQFFNLKVQKAHTDQPQNAIENATRLPKHVIKK